MPEELFENLLDDEPALAAEAAPEPVLERYYKPKPRGRPKMTEEQKQQPKDEIAKIHQPRRLDPEPKAPKGTPLVLDEHWEALFKKYPSRPEMRKWGEKKFLSFIEFVKFFMHPMTKRWTVRQAILEDVLAKHWERGENVYYKEFIVRIGLTWITGYSDRLKAINRLVMTFLMDNPEFITEEIKKNILGWPLLDFVMEVFDKRKELDKEDKANAKIVPLSQDGIIIPDDKSYGSALGKSLNLFHSIADTISLAHIKQMRPEKRIQALRDLNNIFVSAKSAAPRSAVLLSVNVNKATTAKELEDALTQFSEEGAKGEEEE